MERARRSSFLNTASTWTNGRRWRKPYWNTAKSIANTDQYWAVTAELIKPQGDIVSIVENSNPVEIGLLKSKSASFHWTFMFTRSMFHTPDMEKQGLLLNKVADLVDAGKILHHPQQNA